MCIHVPFFYEEVPKPAGVFHVGSTTTPPNRCSAKLKAVLVEASPGLLLQARAVRQNIYGYGQKSKQLSGFSLFEVAP